MNIIIPILITILFIGLAFASCSEEEKKHSSYCSDEFDIYNFQVFVLGVVVSGCAWLLWLWY